MTARWKSFAAWRNDWEIRHDRRDIPRGNLEVRQAKGFLGMLISKEHGGLGFSAQAQSLVIGKIASRSPGCGDHRHGAEFAWARRADREIRHGRSRRSIICRGWRGARRCRASRSPVRSPARTPRPCATSAWSTKGTHDGQETSASAELGQALYHAGAQRHAARAGVPAVRPGRPAAARARTSASRWRWCPRAIRACRSGGGICPAATPSPTVRPGARTCSSRWTGSIGGAERAGQGWRMLMSCLAAGRAISLPAIGTAARQDDAALHLGLCAHPQAVRPAHRAHGGHRGAAGAHGGDGLSARSRALRDGVDGRRRRQARRHFGPDEVPVPPSACARRCYDAMDIHGGKAICDGPSNYLQAAYQIDAHRHHRRGRQHPDAQPDRVRARRAAQPSVAVQGDRGAAEARPGGRASTRSRRPSKAMSPTPWPTSPARSSTTHLRPVRQGAGDAAQHAHWYRQASPGVRNFALVTDLTVALLAAA